MLILNFIIVQIVIFAVLIFVLKKLIFTDTSTALTRLNSARESVKKQEADLEKKKKATEEECRARLAKAAEDADKTLKEGRQKAEEESKNTLGLAKKKAEETVQKATDAKDKIKNDIVKEMDVRTIGFASRVLAKSLEEKVSESFNEFLVENFIKELPNINTDYVAKEVRKVEVISAYKLGDALVKKIKGVLDDKLKRTFAAEMKVDKAVLGGVILKFGTFVIDASLASRIKEGVEEIKKETEK